MRTTAPSRSMRATLCFAAAFRNCAALPRRLRFDYFACARHAAAITLTYVTTAAASPLPAAARVMLIITSFRRFRRFRRYFAALRLPHTPLLTLPISLIYFLRDAADIRDALLLRAITLLIFLRYCRCRLSILYAARCLLSRRMLRLLLLTPALPLLISPYAATPFCRWWLSCFRDFDFFSIFRFCFRCFSPLFFCHALLRYASADRHNISPPPLFSFCLIRCAFDALLSSLRFFRLPLFIFHFFFFFAALLISSCFRLLIVISFTLATAHATRYYAIIACYAISARYAAFDATFVMRHFCHWILIRFLLIFSRRFWLLSLTPAMMIDFSSCLITLFSRCAFTPMIDDYYWHYFHYFHYFSLLILFISFTIIDWWFSFSFHFADVSLCLRLCRDWYIIWCCHYLIFSPLSLSWCCISDFIDYFHILFYYFLFTFLWLITYIHYFRHYTPLSLPFIFAFHIAIDAAAAMPMLRHYFLSLPLIFSSRWYFLLLRWFSSFRLFRYFLLAIAAFALMLPFSLLLQCFDFVAADAAALFWLFSLSAIFRYWFLSLFISFAIAVYCHYYFFHFFRCHYADIFSIALFIFFSAAADFFSLSRADSQSWLMMFFDYDIDIFISRFYADLFSLLIVTMIWCHFAFAMLYASAMFYVIALLSFAFLRCFISIIFDAIAYAYFCCWCHISITPRCQAFWFLHFTPFSILIFLYFSDFRWFSFYYFASLPFHFLIILLSFHYYLFSLLFHLIRLLFHLFRHFIFALITDAFADAIFRFLFISILPLYLPFHCCIRCCCLFSRCRCFSFAAFDYMPLPMIAAPPMPHADADAWCRADAAAMICRCCDFALCLFSPWCAVFSRCRSFADVAIHDAAHDIMLIPFLPMLPRFREPFAVLYVCLCLYWRCRRCFIFMNCHIICCALFDAMPYAAPLMPTPCRLLDYHNIFMPPCLIYCFRLRHYWWCHFLISFSADYRFLMLCRAFDAAFSFSSFWFSLRRHFALIFFDFLPFTLIAADAVIFFIIYFFLADIIFITIRLIFPSLFSAADLMIIYALHLRRLPFAAIFFFFFIFWCQVMPDFCRHYFISFIWLPPLIISMPPYIDAAFSPFRFMMFILPLSFLAISLLIFLYDLRHWLFHIILILFRRCWYWWFISLFSTRFLMPLLFRWWLLLPVALSDPDFFCHIAFSIFFLSCFDVISPIFAWCRRYYTITLHCRLFCCCLLMPLMLMPFSFISISPHFLTFAATFLLRRFRDYSSLWYLFLLHYFIFFASFFYFLMPFILLSWCRYLIFAVAIIASFIFMPPLSPLMLIVRRLLLIFISLFSFHWFIYFLIIYFHIDFFHYAFAGISMLAFIYFFCCHFFISLPLAFFPIIFSPLWLFLLSRALTFRCYYYLLLLLLLFIIFFDASMLLDWLLGANIFFLLFCFRFCFLFACFSMLLSFLHFLMMPFIFFDILMPRFFFRCDAVFTFFFFFFFIMLYIMPPCCFRYFLFSSAAFSFFTRHYALEMRAFRHLHLLMNFEYRLCTPLELTWSFQHRAHLPLSHRRFPPALRADLVYSQRLRCRAVARFCLMLRYWDSVVTPYHTRAYAIARHWLRLLYAAALFTRCFDDAAWALIFAIRCLIFAFTLMGCCLRAAATILIIFSPIIAAFILFSIISFVDAIFMLPLFLHDFAFSFLLFDIFVDLHFHFWFRFLRW